MVVEAGGAAVFGVALEVVQEHAVAAGGDGFGAVCAPAGVDAHAGQGVAAGAEGGLEDGEEGVEAAADGVDVFVGAEGEFEGVVGAVEGEFVAGGGVAGAVEGAGVVEGGFGEGKAGEEVGDGGVYGGEVVGFAGGEVVDRHFEFDARAAGAGPVERGEEARLDGGAEGGGWVGGGRLYGLFHWIPWEGKRYRQSFWS